MKPPRKRQIVGRRIVAVDWRPFDDGHGGMTYDPVFELDNGTALVFTVQETECGEYGIFPILRKGG